MIGIIIRVGVNAANQSGRQFEQVGELEFPGRRIPDGPKYMELLTRWRAAHPRVTCYPNQALWLRSRTEAKRLRALVAEENWEGDWTTD